MRAMQFGTPAEITSNPLNLVELPIPDPGPTEVLIRNTVCAICHTDLHEVEGELPLPKLPLIPGHQLVGEVVRVGDAVQNVAIGERVGMPWLFSTCGACEDCRRGDENLCRHARFTGYQTDGGYADYTIAPGDFIVRIPDMFSAINAAPLLCAGIIGYRSLRLAEVKPGERLGLYGFGASAHLTIQIARHWGCEVYVFTRSQEHREQALRLGAVWSGPAGEEFGTELDSAIIFAPAGRLVLDALRALRNGGTLAINAIYLSPVPEMDYRTYLYGERTVRSVSNATRKDAEEFLAIAAKVPVRTEVRTYPLEDANRALQDLKASKINGAGVLKIR